MQCVHVPPEHASIGGWETRADYFFFKDLRRDNDTEKRRFFGVRVEGGWSHPKTAFV